TEARSRGALELIPKPSAWPGTREERDRLRELARLLATVPVVPHVKDGRRKRRAARQAAVRGAVPPREIDLVVIGASTGGPGVLKELLEGLPGDFAAPIVIVQHLGEVSSEGFVRWLGRGAHLRVLEALPGSRLEPGTAYVAVRGDHITVSAWGRL